MKILFIQPRLLITPSFYKKIVTNVANQHWLALLQLAAITPAEHSIKMTDERYEKINFEEEFDFVLISCFTKYSLRAYEVADEFRKRKKTVILAGHHASILIDEAKEHADSIIIGEPETTWNRFLKDFEKGNLKPIYKKEFPNDKKVVARHKIDIEGKFPNSPRIETSRGCLYSCEFCQVPHENIEGKLHLRDTDDTLKEIKSMESKYFFFADNSLTIDVNHTKALFSSMNGLNKKFTCYGHSDVLSSDDELLDLAKDAGCVGWFVGLESISQKAIDELDKKPNNVDKYKLVIEKLHSRNMVLTGHFMFGFDTDTPEVFDLTIDAVLNDLNIDVVTFMILTPIPGSPLFDRLEKEGRILTKDWSKYTGRHAVYEPKNMTKEELCEGMWKAGKTCNSLTRAMQRTLRSVKLGRIQCLFVAKSNFNQVAYYKTKGLGL